MIPKATKMVLGSKWYCRCKRDKERNACFVTASKPPRVFCGDKLSRANVAANVGKGDLDALLDSLDAPGIDEDVEGYQEDLGAIFSDEESVPVSYGNNNKALMAIEEAAVVMDASNCPRFRLGGEDVFEFLHSQTSINVKGMPCGAGAEACLLTPQGRIIDLLLLVKMESGAVLICSPGMGDVVRDHLEKHIFMNDKVQISDISSNTKLFSVMGPNSDDIMYTLDASKKVLGGEFGCHEVVGFDGKPLVVIKGSNLGYSGYNLLIDEGAAALLWKTLLAFEVEPMGYEAWNISRILSGRPAVGHELGKDYTPYDAGLCHTVCLNKGCYLGQEALLKIYNQDASRWQLWGLVLEKPCNEGDAVYVGDAPVGKITSYTDTPAMDHRSLAYLKKNVLGTDGMPSLWNGANVVVKGEVHGEVRGRVISLPYPQRQVPPENLPGM